VSAVHLEDGVMSRNSVVAAQLRRLCDPSHGIQVRWQSRVDESVESS